MRSAEGGGSRLVLGTGGPKGRRRTSSARRRYCPLGVFLGIVNVIWSIARDRRRFSRQSAPRQACSLEGTRRSADALVEGNVSAPFSYTGASSQILNHVAPVPAAELSAAGEAGLMYAEKYCVGVTLSASSCGESQREWAVLTPGW